MPSIEEFVYGAELGAEIELYEIDATAFGDGILRYTTTSRDGVTPIEFDSNQYTPLPMKIEGIAWEGNNSFPVPTITIANLNSLATAMLNTYDDLIGMKLTRVRTFERYLDDGAEPDPDQRFPDEVYYFEQLKHQDDISVQLTLSSSIDQRGVMLPKRTVTRETCLRRYRRYNSGSDNFDVDTTPWACPYAGSNYFDSADQSTTKSGDSCSQTPGGCRARFPNQDLPGYFFPAVSLNRF